MVLAGVICAVTCLTMMAAIVWKPRITIRGVFFDTYPLVAAAGVLALLAGGALTLRQFGTGLTADTAVNPIKILALFFSMTFLSVYLDEAGFFHYLAGRTLARAGSDQRKLLGSLFLTVSILTVFTSNDIVVLTFTPFIGYFTKAAKINPIPYLVTEFIAANTFSMMLIIGNPTNIYLASGAGIDFLTYIRVMAIPTVFAGIAVYVVIRLLFRKELALPMHGEPTQASVRHKPTVVLGIVHLAVCTVLLAVASYIGLPMWLIAVCAAASLIVCTCVMNAVTKRGPRLLFRSIHRLPWLLIPFVISMFGLVLSLNGSGLSAKIADVLSHGDPVWVYGVTSSLSANIINNIPMSVLFTSLLSFGSAPQRAVYATIIGSNLGAYLTPVGALAGIMWMSLLGTVGVDFSFGKFVSYGVRIAVPAIVCALLGLMISAALLL
ncbi:MAG: hypothetical protein J5532_07760 [Lachnospiraceae bacterium]|nr:hypothetical protein [Lachnospiraceae bacterium]